jgi:VanZ family protein
MKKEVFMKYTQWNSMQMGLFCWFLLLGVMVSSSLLPGTGSAPGESVHLDKIFHFVTNLVATALPLIYISRRRTAILCAAIVPVLGFGLEYSQRMVSGRNFSPDDLLANNFGVVVGLAVGCGFRLYRRYKRNGEGK